MNLKIAHVAYNVKDMKSALDFYVNKLGLEHSFDIKNNEGQPAIEYLKVCDGQFVELFYGGTDNAVPRSYAHLCLQVDDIHACVDELKAKGVKIDSEPIQGKDLNWQCWVTDADGNQIEFMQIDSTSPQARA